MMTSKIKNHLHYYSKLSNRVFATYEEAISDAKFMKELRHLKKSPNDYVEICFIHTLND